MKKVFLLTSFFVFYTMPLWANEIVDKLTEWGDDLKLIVNAVAGLGALFGVMHIAWKYYDGDENANKNLTRWLKGLALVALATVIINFFIP